MRKDIVRRVTVIASLVFGVAFGLFAVGGDSAFAINCPDGSPAPDNNFSNCDWTDNNQQSVSGKDRNALTTVNTIINVALGLIGLVSVVVIILGGFNYVMSQGDPGKITKAKNTIMYGVIGLIVALLAFAIVNFVLTNVFGGAQNNPVPEPAEEEEPEALVIQYYS